MILLAHVTTGAVIGTKFNNPIIIIIISFISHFILDSLPHWNYDVPKKLRKSAFLMMLPDIIPTMLVYIIFIVTYPEKWFLISIGVTFAILPDFLSLSWYIPKIKKSLMPFLKFHKKIQMEIPEKYNQAFWGLLSQTIYFAIIIIIIIKV